MAKASALKADSALYSTDRQPQFVLLLLFPQADSHVVVVFASNAVDMKGYTGSKCK